MLIQLHKLGRNALGTISFVNLMVCSCSASKPDSGKCVLIVEDETLIAFAIADDLFDHGLSCRHVARCEDALAELRPDASQFAAAILDIDLGNHETSEPIAKVLSEHGVPFVFHSGDKSKMKNLAERYKVPTINKPAGTCVLSRCVQALVEHQ